ncbi:bifunctional 4-hydroxy-2-oxoglutarate aldolase/2-dehydro-3-deoxy-phosphogluconate aldolase [Maribacter halichondriae]|uniref:bifunctional 4-hydroxy-2-oxoglutarate aldolase/2-dehydro-3-deoxy-phosphogluconate aldolase n=1 Tax=Maribacter halichondriae TaxID=2980554 RepID=UPI002359E5AD|nr:bifunctional 4-hydroxy-2-oxoglutarate aldolase/2-dehydro-3-deoxy-phosphogluconate aldolase [Maribacter sp. Hal144]
MQHNTSFSWERFKKAPIIGILRGLNLDTVQKITKTYLDAGLYTMEITMNTVGAETIISKLRNEFPEMNIGAGTVCTMKDLEAALNAESQFIVTPIIDENVIKRAVALNIPIFPGAFTPSEIYRAWSLGAAAVKVFPATQLGPKYIKDVLAPLNEIKLIPTGGVSKDTIKSFFEAGAFGVGMGSSLLDNDLIKRSDYEGLKSHFLAIKEEVKDIFID